MKTTIRESLMKEEHKEVPHRAAPKFSKKLNKISPHPLTPPTPLSPPSPLPPSPLPPNKWPVSQRSRFLSWMNQLLYARGWLISVTPHLCLFCRVLFSSFQVISPFLSVHRLLCSRPLSDFLGVFSQSCNLLLLHQQQTPFVASCAIRSFQTFNLRLTEAKITSWKPNNYKLNDVINLLKILWLHPYWFKNRRRLQVIFGKSS